jgi:hypothetical protein
LSGRGLQLSDGDGVQRGRGGGFVRAPPVGKRHRAGMRKGGTDADRRYVCPMDRLRFGIALCGRPLQKALLRARLDRMQREQRALPSSAAAPARRQQRRIDRGLPLLPRQSMRRARPIVVRRDRGEHDVPDRRSYRSDGVLARGDGRRRRSLRPMQGWIHLRGGRLPAALSRGTRGRRALLSGGGRRVRALQSRSGGRRRMHADLITGRARA